ncbi:hypothetical protein JCGZ_03642 [Jatropha curcas]|uniref:Transmembrane protein n=1 Tax=Jatropha curcas TaxID=180498 RepID=A0A067L1R0_JATCU|nr:hypothetical protein JCGZ_03642 [Jatropha curcas]
MMFVDETKSVVIACSASFAWNHNLEASFSDGFLWTHMMRMFFWIVEVLQMVFWASHVAVWISCYVHFVGTGSAAENRLHN